MTVGLISYGLSLLAGVLSTLSPCVLPIVPILLGSSLNAHPRAPLALAAGLAISYAIVGTTLTWASAALNFDPEVFRTAGAVILGLFGILLLSSNLQSRFAAATSGITDGGNRLLDRIPFDGLWGQFSVGIVLGVVWSPCVGPTLGAAVALAGQGAHLMQAAIMMGFFGIGAALPIVMLSYMSKAAISRKRDQLIQAGKAGKFLFGLILIVLSVFILTGTDKLIEMWLLDHSPAWLTQLTTRF